MSEIFMRALKENVYYRILLYIVFAALLPPLLSWAINTISTGYRITSTPQTIDAHGTCKVVSSTSANEYFAPTRTATEWNAFLNNKPNGVSINGCGCKLRYKVKTSTDESGWTYTDWGVKNNGAWVDGPKVYVDGNKPDLSFKVGLYCDPNTNLQLAYRYRGNHGPYDSATIGSDASDRSVTSTAGTWVEGSYTNPYTKSCDMSGGDGGCATMIYEKNESGNVSCDTRVKFNDGNWHYGNIADTYGSYLDGYGTACPSGGCSLQMGIKCSAN